MLELHGLTFRYNTRELCGVNNLSLSLSRGELLALLGPSGAGKSTLLKLIVEELKPQQGHIVTKGKKTILRQGEQLKANWSILENILGQEKKNADLSKINNARALLQDFELTNEIERFPEQLSEGQKQRALLAQKLIESPSLLLLDEPFEHLDTPLANQLMELVQDHCRQKKISLLWVTHQYLKAMRFADRLAILNFGSIQQIGRAQELLWKPRNLFVAQFFGPNNIFASKIVRVGESFWVENPLGRWPSPLHKEGDALWIMRPEHVELSEGEGIKGEVQKTYFYGAHWLLKVRAKECTIWVCHYAKPGDRPPQQLFLHFPSTSFHLLNEI